VSSVLLISVRLHEGRYHGSGEREPSPARLFQALIAGAARGGGLVPEDQDVFRWLETLPAPVIALPAFTLGQEIKLYVPNNDLDALGGDPMRISEVRVEKRVRPRIFEANVPLLYAWVFDEAARPNAERACAIAERLYQFGRGVDLASAAGEILDEALLSARLDAFPGRILRPCGPGDESGLPCPEPGSFKSLERRHLAQLRRLQANPEDRRRALLVQPPKPRFAYVAYGEQSVWHVFDLKKRDVETGAVRDELHLWPLERMHDLVVAARDGAVERLKRGLTDRSNQIDASLVGRRPDGSGAGPLEARVRIIPLPSIGHTYVDRQIRRLLVDVPRRCPLESEDVRWAFSGLELPGCALSPNPSDSMHLHYCRPSRGAPLVWHSVTPVALPSIAARRRIDPNRRAEEAKSGSERLAEETHAVAAVLQALRHAGVRTRVLYVRVQREPFERKGKRAEAFAVLPRFPKERLWHVELRFAEPIEGPLLVGDGRFLGFGLMAPAMPQADLAEERKVRPSVGEPVHSFPGAVNAFEIEGGLEESAHPEWVARALRRTVMARVQAAMGTKTPLSDWFSGHDGERGPAETPHLSYVFDQERSRLLVITPFVIDHRPPTSEEMRHSEVLAYALAGLSTIRAARSGLLRVRPAPVDFETDPLFAPSRSWTTTTRLQVTRHLKRAGANETFLACVRNECIARGLPRCEIEPRRLRGQPGVGLTGEATLNFATAIRGPVSLGRNRHLGGGLFVAAAP
jgi:CRISPR-associated protein Csb2